MSGRIRRVLRLGGVRRGVDEELAHHFDRTVDELMAGGATRAEAEAAAARRFGDVAKYRRELEQIDRTLEAKRRWTNRIEATSHTIRYALRSLARSPGLALGVILAFALGIGANLTMYDIVDRLLLRAPAHIEDAGDVRRIYVSEYVSFLGDRFTGASLSYPDYRALRAVDSFADVAAWSPRTVTLGTGLEATDRQAVYVTANFFPAAESAAGGRPVLHRGGGPNWR